MIALVAGSFFAIAVVACIAGIVEVRTGVRLWSAHKNGSAIDGVVDATSGTLTAPLTKRDCVMFTLMLLRRHWFERVPGGALFFSEQRAFAIVADDGRRFAVDPKKERVIVLGLASTEKPLPFLPTAIAGLLVQRFGRKGQLWAEDYVVRATESALLHGASVHALVEDGVVTVLSTTPLRTLGQSALLRGAGALVVAVLCAVVFRVLQ